MSSGRASRSVCEEGISSYNLKGRDDDTALDTGTFIIWRAIYASWMPHEPLSMKSNVS